MEIGWRLQALRPRICATRRTRTAVATGAAHDELRAVCAGTRTYVWVRLSLEASGVVDRRSR